MRRGTTPTHCFKVKLSLENLTDAYVTYSQYGKPVVEKSLADEAIEVDVENSTLSTKLSQEDTLKFTAGSWDRRFNAEGKDDRVYIQVRLKFSDGTAMASNFITRDVEDVLKDGEI